MTIVNLYVNLTEMGFCNAAIIATLFTLIEPMNCFCISFIPFFA
jgi:hypothetical protein